MSKMENRSKGSNYNVWDDRQMTTKVGSISTAIESIIYAWLMRQVNNAFSFNKIELTVPNFLHIRAQ